MVSANLKHLTSTDTLWPGWPADLPWQEQALTWWLTRGDSAALTRFVRRVNSLARSHSQPLTIQYLDWLADAGRAYQTLLRGDSTGALRGLEALPDSLCLFIYCRLHKLTHVRLLANTGRELEALRLLDKWVPPWGGALFTLGLLDRGRLAERLGERDLAVRSHRRVVDRWRRADPVLQPYVTEARRGLARLTGD